MVISPPPSSRLHTHDVKSSVLLWQMYMRGKLLFVGYMHSGPSGCSVGDLQKQICRSRGDYRLGLSLPADYKFRYCCAKSPANHIYCNSLISVLSGKPLQQFALIIVEFVTMDTIKLKSSPRSTKCFIKI